MGQDREDREGGNLVSATPERIAEASTALTQDRAVEDRLLWKGVLSLLVVVALAYARMRWWL